MAMVNYQMTVADLARLPDDGNRYEVIDGELYVTTAPHFEHQAALSQIDGAFVAWVHVAGGQRRGWALPGAGVIFSFHAGVIPDFLWVSSERLRQVVTDPTTGQRDGKFHAAPDLMVEILSPGAPNEERDRETKLSLYSRRGVREYWIVDRFQRQVEVYRRTEAAVLELTVTLTESDTLTSPLLPDFALPVQRIFILPPEIAGV